MSNFQFYFQLGLEHILDIKGYDHILFVIALCTIYQSTEWKKVLILVTAFTVGHSITLALSTQKIIQFDPSLIEFLIPLTILITAIHNLFTGEDKIYRSKMIRNYLLAGFFGLIHGLGFATYLRAILGNENSIIIQLLAFNVGLEVGQATVIAIFFLISYIFVEIANVKARDWKIAISSAIGGMALLLLMESEYFT